MKNITNGAVAINYNGAGLGDLCEQINLVNSVAVHFNLNLILEKYICSLHKDSGEKTDYSSLMGWDTYFKEAQCGLFTESVNIDSSQIGEHEFKNKFTKIKYNYTHNNYSCLNKSPFDFKNYFELKHGKTNTIDKLCVIHLRMGDARAYDTPFGKFDVISRAFQSPSRINWEFEDLTKKVNLLTNRGFKIEAITDSFESAVQTVSHSSIISNSFGLSNAQICSLIKESGEFEIIKLKSLFQHLYINEPLIASIKRILSAQLVISSSGTFAQRIYYFLGNRDTSRIVRLAELV